MRRGSFLDSPASLPRGEPDGESGEEAPFGRGKSFVAYSPTRDFLADMLEIRKEGNEVVETRKEACSRTGTTGSLLGRGSSTTVRSPRIGRDTHSTRTRFALTHTRGPGKSLEESWVYWPIRPRAARGRAPGIR